MRRPATLTAVVVLFLAAACGGQAGPWQKPAADSTCSDWLSKMTDQNRTDMTGTLFHSAAIKMGADATQLASLITDETVAAMQEELTRACGNEAAVAALPGVMDRVLAASVADIHQKIEDALTP